jgi:hypothetical protein
MALGRWMSSSWTIYIRDNPAVPFQGARPKRMRASGSGESQSRLTTFPLPFPPPAALEPHRWKSRTRRSQCRTRTRASGVARPSATRVSPLGLVRRPRASLTTGSAPSSVTTQAALVQRQEYPAYLTKLRRCVTDSFGSSPVPDTADLLRVGQQALGRHDVAKVVDRRPAKRALGRRHDQVALPSFDRTLRRR